MKPLFVLVDVVQWLQTNHQIFNRNDDISDTLLGLCLDRSEPNSFVMVVAVVDTKLERLKRFSGVYRIGNMAGSQ